VNDDRRRNEADSGDSLVRLLCGCKEFLRMLRTPDGRWYGRPEVGGWRLKGWEVGVDCREVRLNKEPLLSDGAELGVGDGGTWYALEKVLDVVGDESEADSLEKAVVDFPKVMGKADVCSDNFGRFVLVVLCLMDMVIV
jgi:hypothetical protein